jgi:hypothetical protein
MEYVTSYIFPEGVNEFQFEENDSENKKLNIFFNTYKENFGMNTPDENRVMHDFMIAFTDSKT